VGSGGGSEGAKGSEYFTVTRRVSPANQKVKAHGDLNFLIPGLKPLSYFSASDRLFMVCLCKHHHLCLVEEEWMGWKLS